MTLSEVKNKINDVLIKGEHCQRKCDLHVGGVTEWLTLELLILESQNAVQRKRKSHVFNSGQNVVSLSKKFYTSSSVLIWFQ